MRQITLAACVVAASAAVILTGPALATQHSAGNQSGTSGMMGSGMMAPGLMMPSMDADRGGQLFASKGCVVCHAVNGVGGEDAPPLDAAGMPTPMNPFDFAAKMWRGAEAMVYLQREELGEQIELDGDELADIIAFVHDVKAQSKFSEDDIPPRIKDLIGHGGDEDEEGAHDKD